MKIRTVVLWAVTTTFMGVQLAAAKEPPVAAAPLPSQVVNAKKIFISNAGEDNRDGAYNGGADRAYNQFYAALKSWGHYELASTPADADLIFEISFTMPVGIESGPGGNWPRGQADLKGSIYVYDPQFRVAIIDPKSRITLWGFTEHAGWAILGGNRNRNFDEALNRIVADVKGLADEAVATNRP